MENSLIISEMEELIKLRERIERIRAYNRKGIKQYRKNHPEEFKTYHQKVHKNRYDNDPEFRAMKIEKSKEQNKRKKAEKLEKDLLKN